MSVVAEEASPRADAVERYLVGRYEEDGAELTGPDEAGARATYTLDITRVHDDLVPADSGVLLFRGTCAIRIVHGDEVLLERTLHSKVISGRDRDTIHRTITDYLGKAAYRESAWALDEALTR